MEDMWRFRDKPVPLDFDLIQSDQFVLRGQVISAVDLTADGTLHTVNGDSGVDGVDRRLNGRTASLNGISANSTPKGPTAKSGQGLKDLRSLSLRENLALFVSRSVSF
jgi:ubiquitin-like 1-activating enzyme E1 B